MSYVGFGSVSAMIHLVARLPHAIKSAVIVAAVLVVWH